MQLAGFAGVDHARHRRQVFLRFYDLARGTQDDLWLEISQATQPIFLGQLEASVLRISLVELVVIRQFKFSKNLIDRIHVVAGTMNMRNFFW
jgi:hypothetical protein